MKGFMILGITAAIAMIAFYEWPKIEANRKKERRAFVLLSGLGLGLSLLLIFYPHISGPTQFVERLFKPLVRLIQ